MNINGLPERIRHTVSIREMTFAILIFQEFCLIGFYRTAPGKHQNICNDCERDMSKGDDHVGDCRIKRAWEIAKKLREEQCKQ